jgi:hypothetical protein
MAKQVEKVSMFINGDPETVPADALFTYEIVDGPAKLTGQSHTVAEPTHTGSIQDVYDAGIAEIKTKHGIS